MQISCQTSILLRLLTSLGFAVECLVNAHPYSSYTVTPGDCDVVSSLEGLASEEGSDICARPIPFVCSFSAWHFKLDAFVVIRLAILGAVGWISAVLDKTSKPRP